MFIIALCVLLPLLILWLTWRFPVLNKLGSIIVTYIVGCALGLIGLIPDDDATHQLQTNVASVAIPLAIPLLLLSSDIRSWARLAPPFIKSTVCGLLGCAVAVTIAFLVCGGDDPSLYADVGGMLTGRHTGGDANIASIKMALDVDDEIYNQTFTYSTLVSAVYLFFIIVVGKRVLLLFMHDFKDDKSIEDKLMELENHDHELFLGLFRRDNLMHLAKALGVAVIIIALGAGIAFLFPKSAFQPVFILSISLLSVVASLFRSVRNIKRTFEAGTYFILVFSVAVASRVSLNTFLNVDGGLFLFTVIATFGAFLLHVLFSALFRVDTDTTLTTSISLVCSPPFAPVMGGVLHNKAVIGPGIAVGLFGYAIGTYMGFGIANLLLCIY